MDDSLTRTIETDYYAQAHPRVMSEDWHQVNPAVQQSVDGSVVVTASQNNGRVNL